MRGGWRPIPRMDRLLGGGWRGARLERRGRAWRPCCGWRVTTARPPPVRSLAPPAQPEEESMMSRPHARLVLAAGLIAGMLARSAAAQPAGTACTSALDPACTHLKCYQINDKPSTVVSKTPLLQVDNQFGREVLYRLQPVMLCVPSQKACCCPGSIGCSQPGATQGCSAANCLPNPIQSPGLPHFKCYKIKAKTCPNNDCTTAKPIAFPKKTIFVNMQDQFGRDPGPTNCTNIPCSTGQACPTGLYCDTACQPPTPAPCDPCKTQPQGSCAPVSCLRADGTNSQCKPSGPVPGGTCDCCGPTGAFCTSDFDCCSNICNVTASTCQ